MIGEHNIALLAEQAFGRHGDHESVFFEGRWYRSGEMFDQTTRLAAGLTGLGIAPGDRVAVMMANCPEVGIAYSALWRAGAIVTPTIFLLPPQELRHILEDCGARAVITTPEFLPTVRAATDGVASVAWIICLGPEEDGIVSLASLLQAEPGAIVARGDTDPAALLYTGGTTGRAKGVVLTHENVWWCARGSYEASDVPGITRSLTPLPLSHAFGLITSVVSFHSKERGIGVLMRWFDPMQWLELAQEHRIQRGLVVPSMLQILLGMPIEDYDLSSLHSLVCGSSPLAPEVALEFERRVPNVQILEGYGCTESGGIASVNPAGGRKLGSVGLPLPGYQVKILDDSGAEVPGGELGEICVSARGVMKQYWGSPEATEETLRNGWLHTGDIGRVDEDGYIWIADRKKDLIIRGGFNVFPRDVEDVLLQHSDVVMAGVIGRPDTKLGEEVVAFVALRPEATAAAQDLIDFSKERLGRYKYPREVRIVPAIPLTPIGKVDRKALRAAL